MSKKIDEQRTTVQVRLYPITAQACLLTAYCAEYIQAVNVLVSALDADMVHEGFSTKDFTAPI